MNHYEKQLYSVFKTFDVDNEEALDRSAVLELCDSLQLEDRGAALVDSLFERRADRVTFTQFRNGLLSVLGTESSAASSATNHTPIAPPHSDDDSSGREVAPKFVFGAKKYGRRSRPQHPAADESPRHRVASDSRLDGERARQRMRCKRSASAMEHRDESLLTDEEDPVELDHDRRVDRERAVALCRSLRMHGIDRRIVEHIFDESTTDEITVGEFFDRLNSSLTSSVAASLDGAASIEGPLHDATDIVPSDVVVEAWERAGVQRPRRLLLELGFSAAALRPADLERALEDELQAIGATVDEPAEARALLPRAALAVARLRTERVRRRLDVAIAERDKLRADLAEANRRALLLAQDVDENHARIEADLKASLRQLESRHAEAARAAAAQAAVERERAAVARAELEDEMARRADAEGRLQAELTALRDQNEELQRRSVGLEERVRVAEREAARLAAEYRAGDLETVVSVGEGEAPGVGAVAELEARAEALRRDNQLLRDRNDELCAALEAVGRRPSGGASHVPACWHDEVTGLRQECDLSLFNVDQKVLDRDDVVKQLRNILENFQRIPPLRGETCESCSTLDSTILTIQQKVRELGEDVPLEERPGSMKNPVEASVQTELATREESREIETLRKELTNVRQSHNDDKENFSAIIKELESSLEQMKIEYDRCEEYWSCKLEEERSAHSEELRAGDERLAELAAHVAAYERQFRPVTTTAATLPPIDERLALEAQVNDLQDEFAAYRREREAEIADLRARLAASVPVPAPTPAPAPAPASVQCAELEGPLRRQVQDTATCACGSLAARWRQALGAREAAALRARAARAERAAQRLHARLAAADLLVKDLYVENCRLAHLPHPALPAHPAHPAHLPRMP